VYLLLFIFMVTAKDYTNKSGILRREQQNKVVAILGHHVDSLGL